MTAYTAHYTKIPSGYMGQLVEWPEVITEGTNFEDCRYMLQDALTEMVLAYRDLELELPLGTDTQNSIDVPLPLRNKGL